LKLGLLGGTPSRHAESSGNLHEIHRPSKPATLRGLDHHPEAVEMRDPASFVATVTRSWRGRIQIREEPEGTFADPRADPKGIRPHQGEQGGVDLVWDIQITPRI
jgi:hypothetical protein